MMRASLRKHPFIALFVLLVCNAAFGATRYVNATNLTPLAPYTSWTSAATTIQDAVDAANANDLILVTNGVYQAGGRIVSGTLTNRVALTKPVSVQSINGPLVTLIQGYKVPSTTYGPAAVRCVYITNGAVLSGFTLTNGATVGFGSSPWDGGGISAEPLGVISNCVVTGNSAYGNGGGVEGGTLFNCTISANTAQFGGGAQSATLRNCSIINNTGGGANYCTLYSCDIRVNRSSVSSSGGGAANSTLFDCTISGNYAAMDGAGIDYCTASNCTISGNSSADAGGGAYESKLANCILRSNSSPNGAGAANSFCTNCALYSNSANSQGGGAWWGFLENCTITDNDAGTGGGTFAAGAVNCIIYYNRTHDASSVSSNYSSGTLTLTYSCTAPLPAGNGNFTNMPQLISPPALDLGLQSNSPCINAGRVGTRNGLDLNANPRIAGGTVDIGCLEFQAPQSRISYYWLQKYGFPTDGSADSFDPDHDGMSNWAEWRCGTEPTNASSILAITSVRPGQPGVALTWPSFSGINYFIQRATNVGIQSAFFPLATNISGQDGTMQFKDTSATGPGPYFYRVGVP